MELLEYVSKIIADCLVNSSVESFGISHQIPFIEFRNTQDYIIHFESNLKLIPDDDIMVLGLSATEYMLLAMNSVNLQRIKQVEIDAKNNLILKFSTGNILQIEGSPLDESIAEPWMFNNQEKIESYNYLNIIALNGGGFAVWNNNDRSK